MPITLVEQEEDPDDYDAALLEDNSVSCRRYPNQLDAESLIRPITEPEGNAKRQYVKVAPRLLVYLFDVINMAVDALDRIEGAWQRLGNRDDHETANEANQALAPDQIERLLSAVDLQNFLLNHADTTHKKLPSQQTNRANDYHVLL